MWKVLVLTQVFIFCAFAVWPPIPPAFPVQIGKDIPNSDLGGMPVTLKQADYHLCADLCNTTVNCRAWAYGLPNCGGSKDPLCWLKFVDGNDVRSDACRVYGKVNTKPCQLETQWTQKVDPKNTLKEYPRPQLVRPPSTYKNLNGLWEFQVASQNENPPFGKTLNETVLVPFPIESCLSGIGRNSMYMFYRKVFNAPFSSGKTILHFGAVDWQTTVYINKRHLGTHTGGYSAFSFDLSPFLSKTSSNEIFIYVYDPSDFGSQPFGKQRISAITNPGGDTYTPSSGIWQTVWLENVSPTYVQHVKYIYDSLTSITVNVTASLPNQALQFEVKDGSNTVATATGKSGSPIKIQIPNPKIWTMGTPFLYNITITMGSDVVDSYFGLRTIVLGKDKNGVTRPIINGDFTFLNGWLDQSWWPDGLYTAPTDDALLFDLLAVKKNGFNFVRLHQKVNPQRWYYYADILGIIVQQDSVQHYGDQHGIVPSKPYFMADLQAMIDDVGSHPCIIQWTAFNEEDMVAHFDPPKVVDWIKNYDPTRLVDTDSGGPANNLHVGDVNDVHTYPVPGDPKPSDKQFGEVGEYGGLGAFVTNHNWAEGLCYGYKTLPSVASFADLYVQYVELLLTNKKDVSIAVYTQITDVELECDGIYNFDRTSKFTAEESLRVYQANQKLINTPV